MTDDVAQTEAPRKWCPLAGTADDGTEWTWEDGRWSVTDEFVETEGCGPHYTLADLRTAHGPVTVTAVDDVSALWVDWHRDSQLWAYEVRQRAAQPVDPAKQAAWDVFAEHLTEVKAERDEARAEVARLTAYFGRPGTPTYEQLVEANNALLEQVGEWRTEMAGLAGELNTAEAAAGRVRALHRHQKARNPFGVEYDECVACGWIDTGKCPTLAALDGTETTEERTTTDEH